MSQENVELVRRMADAVERRDAEAMAALYAEDATLPHPLYPEPARGREAIRASQQELFDAITDVEVQIRSILTAESGCAAEVMISATHAGPIDVGGSTHAATGRRIEVKEVWVFDLDADGLIVEERDYLDTAALMAQLEGSAPGAARLSE
jgi:steroid delta-isomerase-like uncharacterized protein